MPTVRAALNGDEEVEGGAPIKHNLWSPQAGSSSRGPATSSKRPRQNEEEGILTKNDIPAIVAAVLDASRTGNGAATASTDPPTFCNHLQDVA